jgi:hypothetical protein
LLTDEEAEKLMQKHARERERDLEKAVRDARSRAANRRSEAKEKKSRLKQQAEQRAAANKAIADGRQPKASKRSVYAIPGGAVETNRRKY